MIAATRASGEDNETEFPRRFPRWWRVRWRLWTSTRTASSRLLELYYRIMAEVRTRYAADKRLSTEHSQLDDNGDGVGTERPLVPEPGKKIGPGDDGILSLGDDLALSPSTPPKEERRESPKNLKPKPQPSSGPSRPERSEGFRARTFCTSQFARAR